ncbi:MAG TPA: hybrid sensor histidine kinase/response regulator [Vicinamibacterales bacterium]|nr:hybrid sensor histidine kinase/response regulator [Vicinamibacterales bacterium]
MSNATIIRLAAALSDVANRREAAEKLAHHVGAEALILLVEDEDAAVLLPAPGFPPTLPGGEPWARLLKTLRAPGVHRMQVAYPVATRLSDAVGISGSKAALVFLGGAITDDAAAELESVLPLIASTVRAEHAAVSARGELRAAQAYAREAETLARALDKARGEVERGLRQLEAQTQALQAARGRAEEATRAKDEFLAMLGHELRNPLSPIVTALQLMRLKNQTSREQEVIERQVASLIRLVDDLLDVSRITGGKIDLRKRAVECADVTARAIETVSPAFERKQQRLEIDVPSTGLVLHADPGRIAQVISNLLNNASKYSDEGSVIALRAAREGGNVVIRVRDQGIGITPEMIGRVFDLFEQHPQALDRSAGGLGLGLAIVRSLVHMHGGHVRVSSEGAGRGSEFTVELPLATDVIIPDLASAPATGADLPRGDGERVLIVDDNDDAAKLLHEALATLGYDVRTAADGPTALTVAEEFSPVIGVLDIGLPVMDGYELARRLLERGPIRLVAVSGYGQLSDHEHSRAMGFEGHLVKPIALEELARLLDRLRQSNELESAVTSVDETVDPAAVRRRSDF